MQAESKKRHEAVLGAWSDPPRGKTKEMLNLYKSAYNDVTKDLSKIYTKYLSGINPNDYYDEMLKYKRLGVLQKSIGDTYRLAARKAGLAQYAMSEYAMTNHYYGAMYSTNWFSKPYFSVLNQKAIDVSVHGTPEIWDQINKAAKAKYKPYLPRYGTLSERLKSNASKDLVKIQSTITQGLRQGKAYREVAKELGKVFNTTANNAIRIARTEGNRSLNAGSFANSQAAADKGVDIERQYLATLDLNTREQSGDMDGQRRKINEPFEYDGYSWFIPGNSGNPAFDINDRCTAIDIVNGQDPKLRRGRNPETGKTEVANFNSFDDWTKKHGLKRTPSGKLVSTNNSVKPVKPKATINPPSKTNVRNEIRNDDLATFVAY